jgi:hypothetical protein
LPSYGSGIPFTKNIILKSGIGDGSKALLDSYAAANIEKPAIVAHAQVSPVITNHVKVMG